MEACGGGETRPGEDVNDDAEAETGWKVRGN
jgi:hypothetical protein